MSEPAPTTISRPCPYCKNGSKTGPNGEWQRCVMCGGTGRILEPDPASGTPEPP